MGERGFGRSSRGPRALEAPASCRRRFATQTRLQTIVNYHSESMVHDFLAQWALRLSCHRDVDRMDFLTEAYLGAVNTKKADLD